MVWNELAIKYDELWVQKYSLTPTRIKILSLLEKYSIDETKNLRLLDIGCGTGQLLVDIQKKYPSIELTGIDKAEEMIEQATRKHLKATLYTWDITQQSIKEIEKESFDIIVCSHSFPYYPGKENVLETVNQLLAHRGIAIFIQASINTLYDRLAMYVIEKTAEKAEYLSRRNFLTLVGSDFTVLENFTIKETWYMPSICGFVLRKKL